MVERKPSGIFVQNGKGRTGDRVCRVKTEPAAIPWANWVLPLPSSPDKAINETRFEQAPESRTKTNGLFNAAGNNGVATICYSTMVRISRYARTTPTSLVPLDHRKAWSLLLLMISATSLTGVSGSHGINLGRVEITNRLPDHL